MKILQLLLLMVVTINGNILLENVLTKLSSNRNYIVFVSIGNASNKINNSLQHESVMYVVYPSEQFNRSMKEMENYAPNYWIINIEFQEKKENYIKFLETLVKDKKWNFNAKMILVVGEGQDPEPLLTYAWLRTMPNIISVSDISINTLLPLPYPHCNKYKMINLTLDQQLFADKFKNFNGCPVIVSNIFIPPYFYTGYKGVNGNMIKILSEKLNFTVMLDPKERESEKMSEQMIAETLIKIGRGLIDIVPYPITPGIGQYSYIFGRIRVAIAVPSAEFLPIWSNLITPFSPTLWFVILVLLTFETFLQFLFPPNIFWSALTAKLGTTSYSSRLKVPRMSSRIFLVNMFAAGIVLNTAYHTSLYKNLTLRQRYSDINDIFEYLDKNLTLYGYKVSIPYLKMAFPDPKYVELVKRFNSIKEPPLQVLRRIPLHRNSSVIHDLLFLQFSQKRLSKENLNFHIIEPFATSYNTFIIPKNSRYKNAFDSIIRKVIQSGMFYKWEKDLVKITSSVTIDLNTEQSLSLKHFTSAFLGLFIGYILAFIVFLCEKSVSLLLL